MSEIITLPRDMPEWAEEHERQIKQAMSDLQRQYNLDAAPLVKALCDLYDIFPERYMITKERP